MKRELYIVVVGRLMQAITSMFILRIMTGIMNPLEVGKFTLIMSIISLFALVFVNPIGMYINRKLHNWQQRAVVWQALKLFILYLLVIASIAIIFILIDKMLIGENNEISVYWLIILISGSLIFNSINQTIIPSLNMLGKRVSSVIYSLITAWAGLIISIFFAYWNASAEFWISGQIIGLIIGIIVAIPTFSSILKENTSQQIFKGVSLNKYSVKGIFMFGAPISLAVGLNWVQFQSYRFFISHFLSIEYLGMFFAGYSVSLGIMGAFEAIAMQYFYPIFYKKITNATDEEKASAWNEYASFLFPLTFLTAMFVVIMSKQLTHLLVDSLYWSSSLFVIYGAIIEMGRILGNAYGLVAHTTMKTNSLILPQLIGAIFSIVLVPIMIYFFQEKGVGIGLIISSAVYVGSMHISMQRQLSIKINIKKWISIFYTFILMICIYIISELIKSNIVYDIIALIFTGTIYVSISYYLLRGLPNNGASYLKK